MAVQFPTLTNPYEDVVSWTKEREAGSQALLASQKAQQEELFGKYKSAVAAQPTMQASYKQLSTEAGIPELQSQITDINKQMSSVQQMLNNLDVNIGEQTRGSWATQSQREQLKAAQMGGLTRQMANLGAAAAPLSNQLTASQQNIATQLGLISADQQKQLQPFIMEIDAQSDRFAREITLYDQTTQDTLSALIAKAGREAEMQQAEWDKAMKLAEQEQQYLYQKALNAQQIAASYGLKRMELAASTARPSVGEALSNMAGQYTHYHPRTKQYGQWFINTAGQALTREEAGRIVQQQTGADYNEIMRQIYQTFPG